MNDVKERYLVYSHNESGLPARTVGSAYKKSSEDHYLLFLRILPGVRFYIAPHWNNPFEYVIFSGLEKQSDGSFRLFSKIGEGVYLSKQKMIEIHLPDLRQVFYLKLEPEDFHYHQSVAA